jgi:hypothetical protein
MHDGSTHGNSSTRLTNACFSLCRFSLNSSPRIPCLTLGVITVGALNRTSMAPHFDFVTKLCTYQILNTGSLFSHQVACQGASDIVTVPNLFTHWCCWFMSSGIQRRVSELINTDVSREIYSRVQSLGRVTKRRRLAASRASASTKRANRHTPHGDNSLGTPGTQRHCVASQKTWCSTATDDAAWLSSAIKNNCLYVPYTTTPYPAFTKKCTHLFTAVRVICCRHDEGTFKGMYKPPLVGLKACRGPLLFRAATFCSPLHYKES